jgi:hypothetical protein
MSLVRNRAVPVASALVFAGVLVHCHGSSSGSGSEGNSALGTFPSDYAAAVIAQMDRCAPMAGYLRAERQAALAQNLTTEWPALRDGGTIVFNEDAYAGCLAAQRAYPCEARTDKPPAECVSAARGTVAPGSPCGSSFDCVAESFCAGLDAGAAGQCSPVATADAGQACSTSTDCRGATSCLFNLGRGNVCVGIAGAGADCSDSKGSGYALCDDSSWCPFPGENIGPIAKTQCTARLDAGASCNGGAVTIISSEPQVFPKGTTQCAIGLDCVGLASAKDVFPAQRQLVRAGSCAALTDEGAGCVVAPDGGFSILIADAAVVADEVISGCKEGLVCQSGVCARSP